MDPLQWSMHKRGITKNMESHADNFDMQEQDYSIQKNQQNIFVQDDYGYSAGKVPKVQRNPGELNPGERLYYRAVNHLGNRQQAIEQQKKLTLAKEMEEATFKPQIFTHGHGSKTARQRELRPEEMLQF